MSHEASYIKIGRITKTQGLKGEVRIELLLEDDSVFQAGRRVILGAATPAQRETTIEFFRRQHGRNVVKLAGIDTIEDAERYIGSELAILDDELAPLKEGWFYTFRLKGCRVFGRDGEYLGLVTDVMDSGGAEILKVESENEEILIPFAQSYLKRVDVEQQRIEVDLPDDLRKLNG